ncbi:MAG: chemotaxis-specific protein-glutamate methyltransferase CheB [Chthoniobacteraceae bacterium]
MSAGRTIDVMVVEDSTVASDLLVHILSSDPAFRTITCARSGEEAIALMAEKKPHVMTMDIVMPKMDGYETTRRLMETHPLPIVIVSSAYNPGDVAQTLRTMEAGAVAAVEKPPGVHHPTYAVRAKKLIETVKAMAEVRVVRRWPKKRPEPLPADFPAVKPAGEIKLIAIGASTGGPVVLQTILSRLPKPPPVPVVIVQHISAGFVQGLADWLGATSGIPVKVATDGEMLHPGRVYIAPDDCQMKVEKSGRIACVSAEAENGLKPSVSYFFRSVATNYGASAAGVLLTGMGRDGATELKQIRDTGAVTFAQDQESSIVFGMPGEAVKCGAAMYVMSPEAIGDALRTLLTKSANPKAPPA